MDRPIDPKILQNRIIKRGIIAFLIFIAAIFFLNRVLVHFRPSVKKDKIITAVVEKGDVRETIFASGTFLPETEYIITSPLSTTIINILKQPGDMLVVGDSLLTFDTGTIRNELSQCIEQIRLKENQREQLIADSDIQINALESELEIKKLNFEAAKARNKKTIRLHELGGISQFEYDAMQMDEAIFNINVEQAKRAVENMKKQTETRLNALDLEIGMLTKEKSEIEDTLNRAGTHVTREGQLTWIVQDEGAYVSRGELIARIADLESYLVKATISDIHSAKLIPGLPVILRINDGTVLNGKIRNILPSIENGVITFMVTLEDVPDVLLRSNLRAEVNVVIGNAHDVLRIKKGLFAQGYGINDVFVMRGDYAIRTEVSFGMGGYEWLEITDGLEEGDEVIISDMSDYLYVEKLKIR